MHPSELAWRIQVKNAKPPHFLETLTQTLSEADNKEGSTDELRR